MMARSAFAALPAASLSVDCHINNHLVLFEFHNPNFCPMASAFRRISQSVSGSLGLAEAEHRRASTQLQTPECECLCECPKCPCRRARKERAARLEEGLSDYVMVDSLGECSDASSEDESIRLEKEDIGICPTTPQFERDVPFPWRLDFGFEGGWRGSATDEFSNIDNGRAEMMHCSDILRGLAAIDRTGTPNSMANEAASVRALSMTSSEFLRRRSLTPSMSNIEHMGTWNPPQAYLFSSQPPAMTTSEQSEECRQDDEWDQGLYPRFIRDEDLR
ncbi:hypothetical protein HDK77DRAFT_80071 [Phyllosticta capitalensis]